MMVRWRALKMNKSCPVNRRFLFLAVSRDGVPGKPHREEIIATSEQEARARLAGRFILCFAGRLPADATHHKGKG